MNTTHSRLALLVQIADSESLLFQVKALIQEKRAARAYTSYSEIEKDSMLAGAANLKIKALSRELKSIAA